MNGEERKALREELENFKKSLPTYATQEDIDKRISAFEEKVDTKELEASISELKKIATAQSAAINALKETKEVKKSLPELLSEKKDDIINIAKAGAGRVHLDIDKTLVVRSAVVNHTLAMRLGDVGQAAIQLNVIRNLFPTGTVGANSNGTIRYVDQVGNTRNADWTAEGAIKPESAITWQEYTLPIEKNADTIPVSMESLADVDFIASEIQNLLLKNLALKIDNDLYSGSGVSPIIFGAYTKADTFTPGASGIADANVFDLIVKVQEDITAATAYMPNYAVMNHATYNDMVLKKDGNNNYVRPPFVTSDSAIINVNGIQIVISNSVTANTMLVGDFSRSTLYNLGDLSVDFGFIDKQYIENTITLRAEERLGMLIRTAHTDAFRKVTDIAAALITIAT